MLTLTHVISMRRGIAVRRCRTGVFSTRFDGSGLGALRSIERRFRFQRQTANRHARPALRCEQDTRHFVALRPRLNFLIPKSPLSDCDI